jgi:hypothetical protein
MERSHVAVSPFDGVNRIRFKGSPRIADLRLSIADLNSSPQIGNWKLAIRNDYGLSAPILRIGAPPKTFSAEAVYYIACEQFYWGNPVANGAR